MMERNYGETGNKSIELAKEAIRAAGFQVKGSYKPGEVCKILGISDRTFSRMTNSYEPDPETGGPVNPGTLDSFRTLGQKRVLFNELVSYLARNNTYETLYS
ncbi:MAG: DNA-binding protein [Desulfosalsimonadaceae bacterium]